MSAIQVGILLYKLQPSRLTVNLLHVKAAAIFTIFFAGQRAMRQSVAQPRREPMERAHQYNREWQE